AQGGTLFLDEVANLPLAVQAKLLRVIEERKLQHLGGKKDINVNVRIIAATGTNLWEEVREGKFRNDLFHRLNEFCIDLPPLIERKEDVPVLAKCFLEEENQKLNKKIEEISPEAMKYLLAYNWPGNVRELKNAIRRAVLLADSTMISSDDLGLNNSTLDKSLQFQPDLDKGTSLWEMTKKATEQIEREAISRTLTKVSGNKTKAAKILKIDRTSLYSKIKEFQLE
ncbi:sigma-54-dependent Fis family transcriptional regulator, partial [bacterium]|nr:sigma-54-dependent Fis family transcriptional regulator [bacterium]